MSKLDRMEEISPEVKSRVLAAFAYASAELGMWAFSKRGEIFYNTSPMEKEFFDFFKVSGCYDYMMENADKLNKPLMLSDDLGMVWVAEALFAEDNHIKLIFLMGPFFLNNITMNNIEEKLSEKVFSVMLKRHMVKALNQVPVVYRNVISIYISMLHFAITSEPLADDILYQHDKDSIKIVDNLEERNYLNADNELKGERIFLNAIREGNLNYREIFDEVINFSGEFLTDSGETLRDAKNTMFVFNSLCARAAMDGGVAIPVCRKLEHDFANGIEECRTISMLHSFNENMIYTYVNTVHAHKTNPLISKSTAKCCDYIKTNAYREISLESISSALGYSPYYFSKKFYKEMGIKVTDYIRKTRIDYAKIELLSTNNSIEDISDRLHFGTRNYFSRVFKEETGYSPVEYRTNCQD